MKEKIIVFITKFIWVVIAVLTVQCAFTYHRFKVNPDPAIFHELQVYTYVAFGIVVAAIILRSILRRKK